MAPTTGPYNFYPFNFMANNQQNNQVPWGKWSIPGYPNNTDYWQKQLDVWDSAVNPYASQQRLNSWLPWSFQNGNYFSNKFLGYSSTPAPTLSNPTTTRVVGSLTGNGSALSAANNFTDTPMDQNTGMWDSLWAKLNNFGSGLGATLANENLMKGIGTVGGLGLGMFSAYNALQGMKSARDAFNFNKNVIMNNMTNNVRTTNTQLSNWWQNKAMQETGDRNAYAAKAANSYVRDLDGSTPGVVA